MDTILSFAMAGCLIVATVSFMIAENRLTYVGIGGAALIGFINGQVIVDGVLLTVIASPLLLFLVPAGRRLKKRGALAGELGSAETTGGAVPEAPPSRASIAPRAQATDPKDGGAEKRRAEEERNRAMQDRLQSDPVSAVLRRQVPVRFDEAPRSWLGGLPMMPDGVDWPTGGADRRPLNFMAQIACADLPDRLWRGQGPRDGWLMLFVDAMSMDGIEEERAVILHIDQLGPERQPPGDLGPVHDKNYAGPDYWQLQEDVPTVWRKWPIDIVEQRQEIAGDQVISFIKRDFAPRPTTTEALYGVKQTKDLPRLDPVVSPPRTWGAAADYLTMLIHWAEEQAEKKPSDLTVSLRDGAGWLQRQIASAETEIAGLSALRDERLAEAETLGRQAKEAALRAGDANDESEPDASSALAEDGTAAMTDAERLEAQRRSALSAVEKLETRIQLEKETLSQLQAYSDVDGEARLGQEIEASVAEFPDWWASLGNPLRTMRDAISEQPRQDELPDDVWENITAVLSENMQTRVFRKGYRGKGKPAAIRSEPFSLWAAKPWGDAIMREHYLDLYVASPETRALIAEETIERVEDIARAISWDRPHRMGGLADPLQSDIGPDSPPLLFQIASDTGMNWMWGDAGAIYIGTSDDELAIRQFAGTLLMECH